MFCILFLVTQTLSLLKRYMLNVSFDLHFMVNLYYCFFRSSNPENLNDEANNVAEVRIPLQQSADLRIGGWEIYIDDRNVPVFACHNCLFDWNLAYDRQNTGDGRVLLLCFIVLMQHITFFISVSFCHMFGTKRQITNIGDIVLPWAKQLQMWW